MPELDLPTPADVQCAADRIRMQVRRTPLMAAETLDERAGCTLVFKCEQLQHTGSFKFRGASHAVGLLPPDCPGVATHSSGNHGAALARAARVRGLTAHVVMPDNAVTSKVRAVRTAGGEVHFCAPNQIAREAGLGAWVELGFEAIPPYDDARIIAGQGTCVRELLEQAPELDCVIAPVGGGGLLAGSVLAADGRVEVLGAEPAGADDTARSLARNARVDDHQPRTRADGLRALVGRRNLAILSSAGTRVLTVGETGILAAMRLLWEELKQVIEPSGAVALAAVLGHPEVFAGRRVGVVLSGGNLDLDELFKRMAEIPT